RPGTRHPFSAGAPGIAIQSAVSEEDWERLAPGQLYREEAAAARLQGFATSHDEVIAGLSSVAAPIRLAGGLPAAVAVVYIRSAHPEAELGLRIAGSARTIEEQLS
ncbi:IclR family transcriptional regulator C-terminal domain-containing protein, partial [Arthrobacter sp. EH-1B-1]|nr:IclR family transcriptional regulator C-terminal domain-containing protein [Arthrobacter vasquezii]